MFTAHFESPIGWVEIRAVRQGILSLNFVEKLETRRRPVVEASGRPEVLKAGLTQIGEYFRGARSSFSLPLALEGTDFQMDVWKVLLRVPYGETTTYLDVAAAVGNMKATRAVGGANHRNPISIIVPCHRVVGSDGRLTGYGGGLWRKEWLLAHERKHARH
ncbi:MAG: methylated-DNA--[protein]-cysteine S-methyltransferase [Candidatus Aminicenantales bacterium]